MNDFKQTEIYNLFKNSKYRSLKWEKYFYIYDYLFSKYKNKKITFVEIGILDGGSLEIWKKFFGNQARIIGIDFNPACKKFENKDYDIFIGSQSDPIFWKNFFSEIGKIDILLDDGGHTNDQQIITLMNCFKNINDGGMHVTEDTHTSYMKDYGNPTKYSFINFIKKTIDDINFTFPGFRNFKNNLNEYIYSIEIFESIVALKIDKKLCIENKMIENEGIRSDNIDVTPGYRYLDFKKKYSFLFKIKLIKKLEKFFLIYRYKYKSFKLKKFFK
jgi:hypothetical protein